VKLDRGSADVARRRAARKETIMHGTNIRLLAAALLLLVGATAAAACSDEEQQEAHDTVATVSAEARQEAREAWASLWTEGERLLDRIETRNDPDAQQQLLGRCRDVLERLRKNASPQVERVDTLCDDIREANVNRSDAWDDIRARMQELNREFGG
jgi:hypothetical protein